MGMPALSEESVRDGEYYFEDGLRKVTPYYMLLDSVISDRFMRKFGPEPTLQDFLDDMFPFHNKMYLRYVVDVGEVFLNLEKVDRDSIRKKEWITFRIFIKRRRQHRQRGIPALALQFSPLFSESTTILRIEYHIRDPREVVLRQGDHFARILHIHETPVLDQPIKVIHESEDLVVVNKPASYVVGPQWNTRLNCVRFSLMKEFGYGDVRNIHRIDRLTSGVLIFAKVWLP